MKICFIRRLCALCTLSLLFFIRVTPGFSEYVVQHGRTQLTGTQLDVSITSVDSTNSAFVLFSPGSGYYNGNQNSDEVCVRGHLQATNSIRLNRGDAANSSWVSWSVIECTDGEFVVYRGSGTLVAGDAEDTITLPATVDQNACLALVTADSDANSRSYYCQSELTADMTGSTSLRVRRGSNANVDANYNWVVVVFDTNKIDSIEHGTTTVTTQRQTSPRQVVLSAVDINSTLLLFQSRSTRNTGIPHSAMAGRLSSSTQLEFYQHIASPSGTQDIEYYAIDFGANAVVRRGMIDESSNSGWLTANVPLSPTVDVSRAIGLHCNSCNGSDSGTAYPRPFATDVLTATNLHIQRQYSGQASYLQWQVLEFTVEEPDLPVTNRWNANWTYRRPIATSGPTGGAIRVSLSTGTTPTAADIYDLCRTDAEDLRVAFWTGSAWTELDRDVSAFSSNTVEISFVNQVAGASTNHYIYYGNPIATNAPSIASGVSVFSDDMETDKGWTHGGTGDEWERSGPRGLGGDDPASSPQGSPDPAADHTSGSGTNCWGQDLTGLGTYLGNYENGNTSYLLSPSIDCSGVTNITLNFWRYLNVEGNNYDYAYLDVSTNGTAWTTVWTGGSGSGNRILDSAWTNVIYDISSVADNQSTVYLRFRTQCDGSWTYAGWNIDDVSVYGSSSAGTLGSEQTGWNNDWSMGWNWLSRNIPTSNDTVIIDGNYLHAPEVDVDAACAQLYLGDGTTNTTLTLTEDLMVYGEMDIAGDWSLLGNGGSLTVQDPITIDNSLTMRGGFALTNDATITVNGSFYMYGGCTLKPGTGISSTGLVYFVAEDGEAPTVVSLSTNYSFRVLRGGSIRLDGVTLDGLDETGLNIQDGATIIDIDNVSFTNGASGTYLNLETLIGRHNFSLCQFDTDCQYNVATPTNGTVIVNMINAYGDRAGDAYENEGAGTQINWLNYKQWIGGHVGVETNWHEANNWLPVGVPNATNDIIIPDTGYSCMIYDGTDATCRNIEISDGTVQLRNGDTLTVNGNFYNSSQGTFLSGSSALLFAGTGDQIVDSGGDNFAALVVDKSAGELLAMSSLYLSSTCTVMNGIFNPGASTVTAEEGLHVQSGGTLRFSYNGFVAIGSNQTLLVEGTLEALNGSPGIVQAEPDGWYALRIASGATFNVQELTVSGADTNGLHIQAGAGITALSNVRFEDVQTGGRHLSVYRSTGYTGTFYGCSFDDSFGLGSGNNVYANGGGNGVLILMSEYAGSGSGEDYDAEVSGADVIWTATRTWEGKWGCRRSLTVPAAPTNYSVRVLLTPSTTPTAKEIYVLSRTDGYDVRVGYWDGAAWQELAREVVNFSVNTVEVYFAKQTASASTNYYLYYENPDADIGPIDLSDIYAFGDDFETDRSWTHGGTIDDWQRGEPQGLGATDPNSVPSGFPDPTEDHTPDGVICWGQDLTGLSTYSGNYENNSDNWLRSPPINCSTLTNVHIALWKHLNYEGNTWDFVYVDVSRNGSTWTTAWSQGFTSGVREIDQEWNHLGPFDVSTVADGQAQIYVRIRLDADGGWTYSGWNVDDFKLFGVVDVSAISSEQSDWHSRWSDGWNWLPKGVPTTNEDVVIDGYYHAPEVDVDAVCASLRMGDNTSSTLTVTYDLRLIGDLRVGTVATLWGSGGDLTAQGRMVVDAGGVVGLASGAHTVNSVDTEGLVAISNATLLVQQNIDVDGTLRVYGDTLLGVGSTLSVYGNFESAYGGTVQPNIYGYGTNYSFTVYSGGSVAIDGLTCSNLNLRGLDILTDATIVDIDNMQFVNGQSGCTYLNIGVFNGSYSFMLCTFDAACATNVATADGGSVVVTMINADGAMGEDPAGENNDYDGYGTQINWTYYKQWIGGTSGLETQWNVDGNWSPTGIPTVVEDVLIPNPAGGWACEIQDLAGGVCRTLQISDGTLRILNDRDLTLNGDFLNSVGGTFDPVSGTVVLAGSVDQKLSPVGESFDRLQIDKVSGDVLLRGALTVTGLLDIASGHFDPDTYPVTLNEGMNIQTNGSIGLAESARLEIGDNAQMVINGLINASGSPTITHSGTGRYSFMIASNGTANIRNLNFSFADTNGLVVESGASIVNMNHILFSEAATGGRHLSIYRDTGYTGTLSGCEFDSTFGLGTGHNVFADGNGNSVIIRMSNYGGAGGGETYDDEVNGAQINWAGERTWQGNWVYRRMITVPVASTNYTIRLRLDATTTPTASEVYSLCQADADDLRVGYQTGDSWDDLDRDAVVFSSSLIELYFKKQAAGASTNYYLYYGNASADAAPTSLDHIYSFADNMETDKGWTHTGTFDDWQRDVPRGIGSADPQSLPNVGYVDPSEDHTPEGTRCRGNDLTGIGTIAGDYRNNAANYVQSPAIDCSQLSGTILAYWRWLNVRSGDHAAIQISPNASTWTTIWTNTGSSAVEDHVWTNQVFDVSGTADGDSSFYIRVLLSTDSIGMWSGWNVDDLRIYAISSTVSVAAEETDWNTKWSEGWNWSPSGIPSTNDDVFIVSAVNQPVVDVPAECASLTISGDGMSLVLQTNLTVYGNTSIATNTVLDADAITFTSLGNIENYGTLSAGHVLNLAGNFFNYGAFSNNAGNVNFLGSSTLGGSSLIAFHDVTISNAMTAINGTIDVTGDWVNKGTFFANNGTVNFAGSGPQTVETGGSPWYTIRVNNIGSFYGGLTFVDGLKTDYFIDTLPGSRLFFKWLDDTNDVFEIAASGGLVLSGSTENPIVLRRYGGSDAQTNLWEIYPSAGDGIWTVSGVDVSFSINTASNYINPAGSSIDSGTTFNWFVPLYVQLHDFYAMGCSNAEVRVRWTTATEINNYGFNLYRSMTEEGELVRINDRVIPGLGMSVRGADYEFVDTDVQLGYTYYYTLEAVEYDGRSERYGPVSATPGLDLDGDGMSDDWEAYFNVDDPNGNPDGDQYTNLEEYLNGTDPTSSDLPVAPKRYSPGEGSTGHSGIYKITTTNDGIYRLSADYLSGAGGITNLDEWVVDNIRMYNLGREIPLYVYDEGAAAFGTNDYIEFYAERINTIFTDDNIYWLYEATNAGSRIVQISPSGGSFESNYIETVSLDQNVDYIADIPDESPDDDHWFMAELYDGQTNDFELLLPHLDTVVADGIIQVEMQGMTLDHHAEIFLNGTNIGTMSWAGYEKVMFRTNVSQSVLLNGTNTVTIGFPGDTGSAWEDTLINRIDLSYVRKTICVDEALVLGVAANGSYQYTASGYSTTPLAVYEVTSATNISRITNGVVAGVGPYEITCSATMQTNSSLLILGETGIQEPLYIWEDATSDLRSFTNGADYVIITYDPWKDAAETLAAHRRGEGMRVRTIGVQDIYDDFNYGIFSPYAIRDFLKYAQANWQTPAPTYVLLVGDGTFDYKDHYGLGDINYVPTKLVHGLDYGETGSDNWFVCLDDDADIIPDMYVGRMPARTTNDVETMVSKTITYESLSFESWMTNILLVSDVEDGATSFEYLNESAVANVPESMALNRIRLANYTNYAECRADILSAFDDGNLVITYAGHGSTEQWADPPTIFENTNIRDLNNAARLPFVMTPTCMNGYFVWPQGDGYECLGEELMRTNGRGAVACLSPSAFGVPPNQERLMQDLFTAVFADGQSRVGPAVAQAKHDLAVSLGAEAGNLVNTLILFGDPALTLHRETTPDTTTPYVVSYAPDGLTGATTATLVRITFSEDMDDVATRAALTISPFVEGTFSWNGVTLEFLPDQAWNPATTYTVDLLSSATDLAGNPMAGDLQFTFTPSDVTVSGSVSYTGTQFGVIWVIAVDESASWQTNHAVSLWELGAYDMSVSATSNVWLKAFRDSNKNYTCDTWEAQGAYPLNPLVPLSDVAGIDIVLEDPQVDTDVDGLTDFLEVNVYSTDPTQADEDADGLNDSEEIYRKTNPSNPDSDADGMNDGDEVLAGTSPLNSNDLFRISSGYPSSHSGVIFEWSSVSGRWYSIQGGSSFVVPDYDWSNLVEDIEGTGNSIIYSNSASSPYSVFRLLVTTNSP